MYIETPSTCEVNPSPTAVTTFEKNNSSAIAIATSGVMNEKSIRKFAVPEPRPRHRSSASANPTPSGTAIATTSAESFRLWNRADRSSGSFHTELTSPTYHRVENPCHAVSARLALNENTTAIATGTSDQTTYAIASTQRNRAFPHGFANHDTARAPGDEDRTAGAGAVASVIRT